MDVSTRFFASDNCSGANQIILDALARVNNGHVAAYGHDTYTTQAKQQFSTSFKSDLELCFTYNGTGANIVALASLLRPFEGVLCSHLAHIAVDECGALERHVGNKLLTLPHYNGKLKPKDILPELDIRGEAHRVQPAVISISQPTEYGTLYSLSELEELRDFARQHQLYIHIDGARFANAMVALNCTFEEFVIASGVDILAFGGTKNGLLFGEATLFFARVQHLCLEYIHKQSMQLHSKMRYIAAQYEAYLATNLWQTNASHSNKMANYLAQQVKTIEHVQITRPVQTNVVFAQIPPTWISPLQNQYFFYVWNASKSEVRWMTAFDTTTHDVDNFVQCLKDISQTIKV